MNIYKKKHLNPPLPPPKKTGVDGKPALSRKPGDLAVQPPPLVVPVGEGEGVRGGGREPCVWAVEGKHLVGRVSGERLKDIGAMDVWEVLVFFWGGFACDSFFSSPNVLRFGGGRVFVLVWFLKRVCGLLFLWLFFAGSAVVVACCPCCCVAEILLAGGWTVFHRRSRGVGKVCRGEE